MKSSRSETIFQLRQYMRRVRRLRREGALSNSEWQQFRFHYTLAKEKWNWNQFKLKDWLKTFEARGCHFCSVCGVPYTASYDPSTNQRLIENQTCFGCDIWAKRVDEMPSDRFFIVSGTLYTNGGDKPRGDRSCLGHGGAAIVAIRGDEVVVSNNWWNGGEVPHEFRDRIPNNATMQWWTPKQYEHYHETGEMTWEAQPEHALIKSLS